MSAAAGAVPAGRGEEGATRRLARFAAGLGYEDLDPGTVSIARNLLLDGLACLIVGTRGGPGRSAAAMVRRLGGEPQCTIFADGRRGSVRDAAFVNATTLYSVGLNDIHKPSTSHPGGCIIAPVLAVAEWRRLSGREMLAAMVAGYEVNNRIGSALAPSHRERGFHPTGTVGTFGATAAVGRAMGLDPERLASAFGIAGSQAAGLYEFHHDGTLTIIFHAGRSAQNGVEAVLLVEEGMTGPATVLEGSKGFCRATTDGFDPDDLTRDLGTRLVIGETSFRPFFGCASTIAASAALEAVLERTGLRGAEIERLTVRCHPVVARDNADPDPQTLLAARLSMAFNLALVLDRGKVLTADLTEVELRNPSIRRHLPKVELMADPGVQRFGAILTARAGHRTEDEANLRPPGDASNPPRFDDIADKFLRMVAPVGGEAAAKEVVDAIREVEALTGPELAAVIARACGGRTE